MAFGVVQVVRYAEPGFADPFTDAITYLAAAERLLAGHDLYALGPGDRAILVIPPYWTVPLLYPPTIAVLWVPLGLLGELGLAIWVVACSAVLLWSTWVVASRSMLSAAIVLALSPAIGDQFAVANVNSLFVGALLLVWAKRDQPWIGVLLGTMATVKIVPTAMGAWLLGRRDVRGAAIMVLTAVVVLVLTVAIVGTAPFARYVDIAKAVQPSPMSPDTLLGAPVISLTVLVGGALASLGLGLRQHDRASFAAAVLAMAFGTPALYPNGLVLLLPAIAVMPAGMDEQIRARLRSRGRESPQDAEARGR